MTSETREVVVKTVKIWKIFQASEIKGSNFVRPVSSSDMQNSPKVASCTLAPTTPMWLSAFQMHMEAAQVRKSSSVLNNFSPIFSLILVGSCVPEFTRQWNTWKARGKLEVN